MTTREEFRLLVEQLRTLPGLAIISTNPHAAQQVITQEAKRVGLSVMTCSGMSPMEIYALNKTHPDVSSVLAGGGLPAAPVAGPELRDGEAGESNDFAVPPTVSGADEA